MIPDRPQAAAAPTAATAAQLIDSLAVASVSFAVRQCAAGEQTPENVWRRWVELGCGLPPSAHTNRSIINLSTLGAGYQYTGVMFMIPGAAVLRTGAALTGDPGVRTRASMV